jgi:hypothetical protein
VSDPDWTQLSLTGADDVVHYRRDEVLAFDPSQATNGERVADLARLGYLPSPVLDPTYGYGGMWTVHQPDRLTRVDANPERGVQVADFTDLSFDDRHFASCLYDPPYAYRGTADGTDDFDDRYGTDTYRLKADITELVLAGAVECGRVTDEFLIVKCQRSVVAARLVPQPYLVLRCMEEQGWRYRDELHLSSYRPQPAGRRQINSRSNYSTFLVLERHPRPRVRKGTNDQQHVERPE